MGWRLFSLSVISPFVAAALLGRRPLWLKRARSLRLAALPDGRSWGSTAGVTVAPDGAIRAYDRCGANNGAGSALGPIVGFFKVSQEIV
jgi:hypothetical protein